MPQILDYTILTSVDVEQLKIKVEKAIADGWQPVGEVYTVNLHHNAILFCQPMGLYKKEAKK